MLKYYSQAPTTTFACLKTLLFIIYHFSNSSQIIHSGFQGTVVITSCNDGLTSCQIELKVSSHNFFKSPFNFFCKATVHS